MPFLSEVLVLQRYSISYWFTKVVTTQGAFRPEVLAVQRFENGMDSSRQTAVFHKEGLHVCVFVVHLDAHTYISTHR